MAAWFQAALDDLETERPNALFDLLVDDLIQEFIDYGVQQGIVTDADDFHGWEQEIGAWVVQKRKDVDAADDALDTEAGPSEADVMREIIRDYDDEELDKEIAFAGPAVVNDWPETVIWRDLLNDEKRRREAEGVLT